MVSVSQWPLLTGRLLLLSCRWASALSRSVEALAMSPDSPLPPTAERWTDKRGGQGTERREGDRGRRGEERGGHRDREETKERDVDRKVTVGRTFGVHWGCSITNSQGQKTHTNTPVHQTTALAFVTLLLVHTWSHRCQQRPLISEGCPAFSPLPFR